MSTRARPGPGRRRRRGSSAGARRPDRAPLSALADIGIGIPGVVDAATGVLAHAVNLGVATAAARRAAFRSGPALPVAVENDVNAAALGASGSSGSTARTWPTSHRHRARGGASSCPARCTAAPAAAAGEIGHVPVDPLGPMARAGSAAASKPSRPAARSRAWPVATRTGRRTCRGRGKARPTRCSAPRPTVTRRPPRFASRSPTTSPPLCSSSCSPSTSTSLSSAAGSPRSASVCGSPSRARCRGAAGPHPSSPR